jgi:hypothetical protein
MIKQIFLDIDDVLNTFTMSALYQVGCDVEHHGLSQYRSEWGYDIVRAANELHPYRRFTKREFWESLRRRFWSTISKSSPCDHIIERSFELVGEDRVCLLSAPTLDPDCLAGKVEWIEAMLPKPLHRQYAISPRKHFFARPDTLLIDDKQCNVEAFKAAGGAAFTFPAPWNQYAGHNPRQTFDLFFDTLMEVTKC